MSQRAHRPDGRRRRHHPGRAGPGDPRRPAGRAGRAGRPRHRQDRRRAAPRRLPALHPPPHPRAPRRARHRPERHLPALHRPGAAVAGRDRRGPAHARRPVPRRARDRHPRPGRGRQGRRADGPACSSRRSATGSGCRRHDLDGRRRPGARSRCGARRSCAPATAPASTRRPHNVARKLFVTELLNELARAEARVLDRPFDDEDLPYARERLWSEPGVVDALDAAVAAAYPGKAAGRAAEVARQRSGPPPDPVFPVSNGPCSHARTTRLAGRWRTSRCSTRPPSCSASTTRPPRRPAARSSAPSGWRRSTPRRCSTSTGVADLGAGRRRDAGRLEPRQRPGPVHRRARRRRPHLGLRARDHRRGPGALRDGLADGAAPQPDPLDDRGRRRRPDRLAGRRPIVEGDAESRSWAGAGGRSG